MADTTIGPAHGTLAAATAHKRDGSTMCLQCADETNDYRQAWRITSGNAKSLRVPISVLRQALAGADLATALGSVVGPRTMRALRAAEVPRA